MPPDAGPDPLPDAGPGANDSGRAVDSGVQVPESGPEPADSGMAGDGGAPLELDGGADDGGVLNADGGPEDGGPAQDAALAVGMDSGVVVAPDSGLDAGFDSGVDSGIDSGVDSGMASGSGVDSGPDGGQADAGMGMGWWDPAYLHRKNITLTADDGDLMADAPIRLEFNHEDMVDNSGALANGDDLRVVCFSGSAWVEMPRVLTEDSNGWDRADTLIMTRLPEDLDNGESFVDCFLYYGNGTPAAPLTDAPPNRFVEVYENAIQTTSGGYVDRATLVVPATRASEAWVVVFSWEQRHLNNRNVIHDSGWSRIRINGTVRTGVNELVFRQSGDAWKSMGVAFVIKDVNTDQTVALQHSGRTGNDSVRRIRGMAFVVPNHVAAGLALTEDLTPTLYDGPSVQAASVDVQSTRTSDWLWFASGSHREGPGGATGELHAIDESGAIKQVSAETYIDDNDGFVPLLHMEKRTLAAGGHSFAIDHTPSPFLGGSRRQGLTLFAFDTSRFADVFSADQIGTLTHTGAATTALFLDRPFELADRDHVYLGVANLDHFVDDITESSYARFKVDGTVNHENEMAMDRLTYAQQIQTAFAERRNGDRTVLLEHDTEAGQVSEVFNAHLSVLRYREATVVVGSEEDAP
jgi:hypothetical protein